MDLLLNDLPDDRQDTTFHLIRLPKEACELGSGHVGSMFTDANGSLVFQTNNKNYLVVKNHMSPPESENQSDLVKVSLNPDELVHLGKVGESTLICVPTESQ